MDRIDLHIEVDNVTYDDLASTTTGEPSATVKTRVDKARDVQLQRFQNDTEATDTTKPKKPSPIFCNAKMTEVETKQHCALDKESERVLREAFEKLSLSARAYTRILRVARTIADMEGEIDINADHISEAVSYRSLDRKYKV